MKTQIFHFCVIGMRLSNHSTYMSYLLLSNIIHKWINLSEYLSMGLISYPFCKRIWYFILLYTYLALIAKMYFNKYLYFVLLLLRFLWTCSPLIYFFKAKIFYNQGRSVRKSFRNTLNMLRFKTLQRDISIIKS